MMAKENDIFNDEVLELLEKLQPVPPRKPEASRTGYMEFLSQAESLKARVSIPRRLRLNQWLSQFQPKSLVLRTLTIILISLIFLFAGGSVMAYSAGNALPGDALYNLKIWVEHTRLTLVNTPQDQFDLHLELAKERINEIEALISQDVLFDEDVVKENLERHLYQAAALLESGELLPTAEQQYERMIEEYNMIFPGDEKQENLIEPSSTQPNEGQLTPEPEEDQALPENEDGLHMDAGEPTSTQRVLPDPTESGKETDQSGEQPDGDDAGDHEEEDDDDHDDESEED